MEDTSINNAIDRIISDLKVRVVCNTSIKPSKMTVKEFKELPEVKEIITTISVLEKYYR